MADEDENKGTPEEGGEPSEETKEPSEEEAKRKKQEEQEEKKRKKQEAKEEKKRKKEERKKRKKGKKGGSEDDAEEGEADEDEDVDEEERSIREKIKYEKQLVKEGKILPRGHYIPKGRLRGILAVCLAFFFGIFVTFGALFGVVAYFANFKVREVLKFALGSDSEMNPEDYIAQEYLDGTIFELYGAISDEFGSMDPAGLTIGKFAKYSPYIRTLAEELKEQVAVFGVQCDLDELFATPLSQYGEYLQKNVLMNVEVGKAAGLKADSDPLLLAFCYGEKGVDYEVGPENTIIPKEGGIGPLTVGGIIGGEEFTGEAAVAGLLNRARTIRLGPALEIKADADPLLLAFLYGEKGVDYEVGPENTIIPKEGGIGPLTVGGIIGEGTPSADTAVQGILDRVRTIRLGSLLGFGTKGTETRLQENAAIYTICYGDWLEDFKFDEEGNVILLGDNKATTVGDLIGDGTDAKGGVNLFLESLNLGSLLGLNLPAKLEGRAENTVLYALCYGAENTDFTVEDGRIQMAEGKTATKISELMSGSTELIRGLEVESLLGVNAASDSLMRYLAYGAEGVDYKITEGEDARVEMLPIDPDDPASGYHKKRTVGDLLEDKLVEGIRIRDIVDTGDDGLLFAIKDWTIGDFNDPSKIDTLKVGDILGEGADSLIMKALAEKTIGDLKKQETIDGLKLGDIIATGDSRLMNAMKDWTVGDLSDQKRIESLKLCDIIDTSAAGTSPLIKAMQDWSIGELSEQKRIERLKIGDLFDAGDSKLMQAMKDWRIGDLSDQNKMDGITLRDVMGKQGETGLLAAIGDIPLGDLETEIASLPLSSIFSDPADLEGNMLLKHLTSSTLDTLADDLKNLTVGEVFGDEIYSYMEITQKDGKPWGYTEMRKDYFGADASDPQTPHYLKEEYNTAEHRPTALTIEGDVTAYRVLKATGERLTEVYCTFTGGAYVVYSGDEAVLYDAAINMANRAGGLTQGDDGYASPYYIAHKIVLTPSAYGYGEYVRGGTVKPLEEKDGSVVYEGSSLPILGDEGNYYVMYGEKRIDLERYVTSYTGDDGKQYPVKYTEAAGQININTGYLGESAEEGKIRRTQEESGTVYYFTENISVYKMFRGAEGTYPEAETEERFEYQKADGSTAQLERYLSGVWYLLLTERDKNHTITAVKTDTKMLDLGAFVSGVAQHMTDMKFCELWFSEIMDENPYMQLFTTVTFVDDTTGEETKVNNLIQLSLGEMPALIKALNDYVKSLGSLLG